MAQHSWPSMEIRELCCIIWSLTPAYPILITWKNCIHPGKMYSPQGVRAWDYLPVLRKGRSAQHRDGQCALRGNPAQPVRSRAQPFPHWTTGNSFTELGAAVVRKDLQGARALPMPFMHLLDAFFFWFKLSIQLISYFFLHCFFPLFILFSLAFLC